MDDVSTTRGFSLIEVTIALLLLLTVVTGIVPMLTITARAVRDARTQSMAAALAIQKLEQLRALCWAFDAFGVAVTDVATDTSGAPFGATGPGLSISPPDALDNPAAGFADYLDTWGRWLASGAAQPPAAAFRRRWSVRTPAGAGAHTLLLEVVVEPVAHGRDVHLATVLTRKGAP